MSASTSVIGIVLAVYGLFLAFTLLVSLAFYILTSLGFYSMAKRRGIPHPGLAWVPIGGQRWILGSLADQYAYLAEGKTKRQRFLLLWLDIGINVLAIVFMVWIVAVAIGGTERWTHEGTAAAAAFMLGFYFLMIAASITFAVFTYISLYQVYKSCDPKNATLFLVLSIVVNVTMPFFVFFSRNKDLGMPPASPAGENPERIGSGPDAA